MIWASKLQQPYQYKQKAPIEMTEEGKGDGVMVKLLTKTGNQLLSELRKQCKNVYSLTGESDGCQMNVKLLLLFLNMNLNLKYSRPHCSARLLLTGL